MDVRKNWVLFLPDDPRETGDISAFWKGISFNLTRISSPIRGLKTAELILFNILWNWFSTILLKKLFLCLRIKVPKINNTYKKIRCWIYIKVIEIKWLDQIMKSETPFRVFFASGLIPNWSGVEWKGYSGGIASRNSENSCTKNTNCLISLKVISGPKVKGVIGD